MEINHSFAVERQKESAASSWICFIFSAIAKMAPAPLAHGAPGGGRGSKFS
jgi:hypothetical protein